MTVDVIWRSIPIKPVELSLARVLRCGQTFRWKNIDDVWSFAIHDRIVLLKQDDKQLQYSWIMSDDSKDSKNFKQLEHETLEFINDYFLLSTNLESLYNHWQQVDCKYHKVLKHSPFMRFPGIRILRQEPWETTISFICSSNNNVKRISMMCDRLCDNFGKYINDYKGVSFYSFPRPEDLIKPDTEQQLRGLGFGYRAKYVYNTACKFVDETNPEISMELLMSMRLKSDDDAREFLLQLTGVGPKVADCICLMALDKHDVVPVDTHVYQMAVRDFKFRGKRDPKSLNKQAYDDIRNHFKQLFGPYAGWAQSVLFASDLADLNNGINQVTETKRKIADVKEEAVEVKKEVKKEVGNEVSEINKEVTEKVVKRVKRA